MKLLRTILILSASLPDFLFAGDAKQTTATNVVIITSDYVNRLAAEARTNNPSLRASDSRARASALQAESIRTWEDPTAMLGGSVYSDRGFSPSEDGNLAYGVEEKLPLWNKPTLTRRVAQAESSMRRAEVDLRFQQVRRDIARGLLATAFAERAVQIGDQDLIWLKTTAQAVENRYRNGSAVIADTLQIQNVVAKRTDTLRTDRNRLDHERFTLNRLLNRPPESLWPSLELPPVGPAVPLSQKLLALALQNEPKLKVLAHEIRQAQAAAELTRKSRLPDVSLGVGGRQYSGDGGFREGDFTLRVSLPWFNSGKYRKDYERDKERQKSAEQDREDQELIVREELHHLSVEIEAARREALLYSGEISPRAEQAVSSRVADWEAGNGTLRDVLEARRTLLDSELMAARANAQENEMFAEMLLWTGLESVESLAPLANEPSLLPDHDNPTHHHE